MATAITNVNQIDADVNNLFWNNTTKRLGIGTKLPIGIRHTVKDTHNNPFLGECGNVGEATATSGTFTRDATYPVFELKDSGTLTDDGVLVILYHPTLNINWSGTLKLGFQLADGTIDTGVATFDIVADSATAQTILLIKATGKIAVIASDSDNYMCVYATAAGVSDSAKITIKNRLGATVRIWYHFVGSKSNLPLPV